MRAIITTATVVALLAAGAGSAASAPRTHRQDLRSPDAVDAATRADAAKQPLRGPPTAPSAAGTHADALRYQAEAAYYRHHRNVAPGSKPAPATAVHVTRLTDGGFDWADAGIGAGLAAALLLSAAGASALRRQHPATR
jgi:hypothetical protein